MSPPISPRGRQAIGVSSAFTALAALVLVLRLYTRFFIVRAVGIEDYFITLATLCSLGLTICIGIQAEYGMGQHITQIAPEDGEKSLKAFWASLIVYYSALGLTKSSILLQYRRVFPTKKFQIACWTLMTVVACYTIWTLLGSIFACIPVQGFWTKQPSTCINQFAMWFTNAGINIATDFAIIVLPIPVIQSLNLARRQKQALTAIFAIGGFVCVVSILRLKSLIKISNSTDQTYDNPPAATWSSVENNIGIICSCLPCLRPLVARCCPGLFSSNKYGANSAQPHNRSAYGRRSAGPSMMMMVPIDSKHSRDSSEGDIRDDRIQVVTEVRVQVENKDHSHGLEVPGETKMGRAGSTETLVRDAAPMV